MAWRWRNRHYQRSKGSFATKTEAVANAVGCAIAMQKGKKPGTVMEEPDQEIIDQLWPGMVRAGWRVWGEAA